MPSDPTPEDIAQWMLDHLEQRPELYQIDAVDGIVKNFGGAQKCRGQFPTRASVRCAARTGAPDTACRAVPSNPSSPRKRHYPDW